jgi:hypothetical protein
VNAPDRKLDRLQSRLAGYAAALDYAALPPSTVQAAKVRVIDTLAALAGGFDGEPCAIARRMAARTPLADGATVYGTATRTTPEMAAFANATAARYVELNDVYHWPGQRRRPPERRRHAAAGRRRARWKGRARRHRGGRACLRDLPAPFRCHRADRL